MSEARGETRLLAMGSVFENGDLVALVVTNLRPACYVSAGRVCRLWRGVCRRDASLAITAAKAAACLTKRVLMGLLALSSGEADSLPRETHPRRDGGVMYVYPSYVVDEAWVRFIGSGDAWRARLVERSRRQRSIERSFGPEWRVLQWSNVRRMRMDRPLCAVY